MTAAVITLVGAGINAGVQYSQGKAQERVAAFNYAVQSSNAKMNQMSQLAALQQQRAQSSMAMRQAEINAQLANSEADARNRNAELIRQTAEAQSSRTRDDIRRKRMEYMRFQATQQNRIAASGVTASSGSPLEMLAETAGQMQLSLESIHSQSDLDRNTAFNQAAMEDFGAALSRSGNNSALASSSAANRIRLAGFDTQAANVRYGFKSDMAGAEIARLGAFNQAKGTQMAAAGTLFSGYGDYKTQKYQTTTYAGA